MKHKDLTIRIYLSDFQSFHHAKIEAYTISCVYGRSVEIMSRNGSKVIYRQIVKNW